MARIIDLRGKQGHFETNPAGVTDDGRSIRTFGLWSCPKVSIGDYVVRPQPGKAPSLLQITSVAGKVFTGSDGNKFWKGRMEGIEPDTLHEHPAAFRWLEAAGLITRV